MKQSMKKLNLNKERIATLSNLQMRNVVGGFAEEEYEELSSESAEAASRSTIHSFTCSWCVKLSAQYKKGKEVPLNR